MSFNQCTGACKALAGGACNCSQYSLYLQPQPGTYVNYANTTGGMTETQQILQYIQQITSAIGALSGRMQSLEDMMVDVNGGIDELLAERTHNKCDEKVCGCSEAGCGSGDSSGDTTDPAEPSSLGQEVS